MILACKAQSLDRSVDIRIFQELIWKYKIQYCAVVIDGIHILCQPVEIFLGKSKQRACQIAGYHIQIRKIFFFPAFIMFHIGNDPFHTGFFGVCPHQTGNLQTVKRVLCDKGPDEICAEKAGSAGQEQMSAVFQRLQIIAFRSDLFRQHTFIHKIYRAAGTLRACQDTADIRCDTGYG